MGRPILYDTYCGAGGCTEGYQRAGFEVWGVDINPQPRYCGSRFIQMDAIAFIEAALRGEYPMPDAWHASPPCQGYSRMLCVTGHTDKPKLIAETRDALARTERPYVIENVELAKADMRDWVLLCGTGFGLRVRRHRLFELSPFLPIPDAAVPLQERRQGWRADRPPSARAEAARPQGAAGVQRAGAPRCDRCGVDEPRRDAGVGATGLHAVPRRAPNGLAGSTSMTPTTPTTAAAAAARGGRERGRHPDARSTAALAGRVPPGAGRAPGGGGVAAERLVLSDRQGLIDAANERMCRAKQAALDAYARVHPVGHARCTDRCREAHGDLIRALRDIDAEYGAAVREGR